MKNGRRALLDHYLSKGIPVFPLQPGGKKPLTKNGFKDATRDIDQALKLFERYPNANIGAPTGQGRFTVIDVDDLESLAKLEAEHGTLPLGPRIRTPRGGLHLCFAYIKGVRCSAGKVAPGIDVRNDDGYIVMAGSTSDAGDWTAEGEPLGTDTLPALPEAWQRLLNVRRKRAQGWGVSNSDIPSGARNSRLTSFAGRLRREGSDQGEILSALSTFNLTRCQEPLPDAEVQAIANSVARYDVGDGEEIDEEPIPGWPELKAQALHGIAGDFIRLVRERTEADPAGLLVQFLTCFGNVIDHSAHIEVTTGVRHFANLNSLLIGVSSKGRKGTSFGLVEKAFETCDDDWLSKSIQGGLSSGEGVVYQVRDPLTIIRKGKEEEVPGAEDKRLLIFEGEFAQALKVLQRDGNTLSPILRNAWDHGNLNILTKNDPHRATGAHISIIGHVTDQELVRYLTENDAMNGFANRFLHCLVRRQRYLPDGGKFGDGEFAPLQQALKDRVRFAKHQGRCYRDGGATEGWRAVYKPLSEGDGSLAGTIAGRGEAQVSRLSVIYALLDGTNVIDVDHLAAAMAVWEYCKASVYCIFGETEVDPRENKILHALKKGGELTRNQILTDVFQGNIRAAEVKRVVQSLVLRGKLQCEDRKTGGRPAQVFSLTVS